MLEKIKLLLLTVGVIALIVLAKKSTTSSFPIITYQSVYEVSKDLKKDITESFGVNSSGSVMYSYIPAYSHIYISQGKPIEMAVTLSLRNIDIKNSIQILKILYFDTKGQLIRNYLKEGHTLAPLETKEIFIKNSDKAGGSGANFVVLFTSNKLSLPPIFEAIMSSESAIGQSNIFTSRGVIYSGQGIEGP